MRNGISDIDDVHTEVERFTRADTGSTWHVIARTSSGAMTYAKPAPS